MKPSIRFYVGGAAVVVNGVFAGEVWGSGFGVACLATSTVVAVAAVIPWRSPSMVRALRLLSGGVAAVLGSLVSILLAGAAQAGGLGPGDQRLLVALPGAVLVAAGGAWVADIALAAKADQEAADRHEELFARLAQVGASTPASEHPAAAQLRARDVVLAALAVRVVRRRQRR
ncbi:hypothetical protein [Cellulomonas carbonis]|uniref:hypothetical protein n=1 Tax=Cellulomonas carbonis TaxID=1386092 RepID=UPI0016698DCA|nr:hypothetical protein [Cellulomonas carbonis]GGC17951.1 hypothetical protein GCM10010972_34000 [Cellulomonas carbonis]